MVGSVHAHASSITINSHSEITTHLFREILLYCARDMPGCARLEFSVLVEQKKERRDK